MVSSRATRIANLQTRLEALEAEIALFEAGRTTEYQDQVYKEYNEILDLMDKLEPTYEVWSGVLE